MPAPEDWLPAGLSAAPSEGAVRVVERTEAVPADPATAAELGAEVQRLRDELGDAQKRARADAERADRAERDRADLQERVAAMKRAAAQAAAATDPGDGDAVVSGKLDLNTASFEQLREFGPLRDPSGAADRAAGAAWRLRLRRRRRWRGRPAPRRQAVAEGTRLGLTRARGSAGPS
jgi:hypothetical protein